MWKAPFDIFHNVVKYNLNFPHCGNYNPQCEKNIVRFSTKLEFKSFMFHNVQNKLNKKFHIQCGKRKQCLQNFYS